jgi:hypothetical protein
MVPLTQLRPAVAELTLAFMGFAAGIAVIFIIGATGIVPDTGPGARAFGFIAGPTVTAIAAVFYAFVSRTLRDSVEPALPEPDPMPRAGMGRCAAWVFIGAGAALVGSFAVGFIMDGLGFPVEEQSGILEITRAARRGEATLEAAVLIVSAAVLAPLAEEGLFRGMLFRRIRRAGGRPLAFALSAVAFAVIHTNPAGFVVYLWLGLVFAYILERTGRLWTAVAVHGLNNAVALVALLLV